MKDSQLKWEKKRNIWRRDGGQSWHGIKCVQRPLTVTHLQCRKALELEVKSLAAFRRPQSAFWKGIQMSHTDFTYSDFVGRMWHKKWTLWEWAETADSNWWKLCNMETLCLKGETTRQEGNRYHNAQAQKMWPKTKKKKWEKVCNALKHTVGRRKKPSHNTSGHSRTTVDYNHKTPQHLHLIYISHPP